MDDLTLHRLELTKTHVSSSVLAARWAYYVGDHPKIYATPKIERMFAGLADSMTDNYCGLAVNTRLSRLQVTGFDPSGQADDIWAASRMRQRQDSLWRWALVYGSAYIVAAQDEDGQDRLWGNRPTTTYAMPDPADPFSVLWAGKIWADDRFWYAAVWDEESVQRFTQPLQRQSLVLGYEALDLRKFVPAEDGGVESHGYERVPVVPLLPYGEDGGALIDAIAGTQDRINKLSANKFVAAEFGAFRQRVFFTRQQLDDDDVRNRPDSAILLDPGDRDAPARVEELDATDLKNYDDARSAEVDALFTLASLPRHLRVNPGTAPSGEAIKADEGPLVEAVTDHQRELGEGLSAALALLGVEAEPVWKSPETRNEATDASAVSQMVMAGVPWQAAVQRYAGWSPDDVADAELAGATAQASAVNSLGAQLLGAG